MVARPAVIHESTEQGRDKQFRLQEEVYSVKRQGIVSETMSFIQPFHTPIARPTRKAAEVTGSMFANVEAWLAT